jgi:phage tail sheath protein FI
LAGLEVIDEISLLCVPDHVHPSITPVEREDIMNTIVNQCELLKDRFAILQIEGNQGNVNTIDPLRDTKYAAVYYPWIRVYDPRKRTDLLVPPGGHVTGIIARTDIERGVHKPPANAVVRGIINRDLNGNKKPVEFKIVKGQHDILNPKGINVIRDFRADGRGIRVWGARTMSSDPEWKYVNVRRLFLFVEESIEEGTQWVVFEPNHEPTWAAVTRTITNFLISVWRSGALMGTTQDEAFFVKCDRSTMTKDDIDNGRLICFIGIAPVKPAEFVIFRFSQKTVEATG